MNSPTPSLGPRGRGPAGARRIWPPCSPLGGPAGADRPVAGGPRRRKGGRRITFGCAAALALTGNGVIAPLRDGVRLGWGVKDMRRPPFWVPHRGTRPFSPARAAPDHIPCASRTSWIPCSTRPGGAARVRVREMALWEDRSAPHSSAVSWEPRNHAETAGCAWCVGPNDPPAAPEPEFDGVEERPRARRRGLIRPRSRPIRPGSRTATQGRPGRSRKTRREPIRPSMRTRTPPRPRPIPRRGARGACRGGAGEVI